MLVGDPKQAICRFCGAEVGAHLDMTGSERGLVVALISGAAIPITPTPSARARP